MSKYHLTSPYLTTALGLAALLSLVVGVWGAWLPHPAAGLVILGIDLPEYVKFLPPVQSGAIPLQREVFFLPLIALVGGLILLGSWRNGPFPLWLRLVLLILAVPATLAMLPPAWTPFLLRQPEFRLQMMAIALLLAADILTPLWARLPSWLRGILLVGLAILPWLALHAYSPLRPVLAELYREPLVYGPGIYGSVLGSFLLAACGLSLVFAKAK